MNKLVYRLAIMSLVVILLLSGTYIGLRVSNNVIEDDDDIIIPKQLEIVEETAPVVGIYENKTNDIQVIYEDYYTNCKHTTENKNMIFGTTKEKILESVDLDYELIEETEYSMVFRRAIDSNCPNHFELKLEDDYVVIYQRLSNVVSIIYKNTEVPITRIRDELITKLEKGIKVDSLEELYSYMEDIES